MSDYKEHINKLRQLIQKYNWHYYQLNSPLVKDSEYDRLFRKLKTLEAKHPTLIELNSPTQQVGTKINQSFSSITHQSPMLSLDNAFHSKEVYAFQRRITVRLQQNDAIRYVCEPKIDGVAVNLLYHHGKLFKGATRGDGKVGEDITHNLETIKSIPTQLPQGDYPEWFEIRGEVYLETKNFQMLNDVLTKAGQKKFVNPRNAASGSLRQLDPEMTATRPLSFFAHGYGNLNALIPPCHNHSDMLKKFKAWKVPYCPLVEVVQNIENCLLYYEKLYQIRKTLPYEIDGVVYKVDKLKDQAKLGNASRSPRWAIAHKFPAEEMTTKLLSVAFQVGRTGILTPVAHLAPVFVGGATISHATLHNQNEIKRKDIREGDEVVIRRAGDVIPEVVSVRFDLRHPEAAPIQLPTSCPACHSPVQQFRSEVYLYCGSPLNCPAQQKARFLHFASRKAADIDGLGEQIIMQLVNQGLVKQLPDLYQLTQDQILTLDKMGPRSSQKLIESIHKSKKMTFQRFLYGLGIPSVGINTALALTEHFVTLAALMKSDVTQLEGIPDIGPMTANHIYHFFQSSENQDIIQALLAQGIHWTQAATKANSSSIKGKTFVITGTFSIGTRDQIKEILEARGAKVSTQLSHQTTYLLVGETPGTKLNKANTLQIPLLYEKDLIVLIQ